ncbi:hypothetical protein LZ31DRAFT_606633 [Colletotrichum somersetense]|nr:hypothetical protein LZ31DRAFT_606633 [Colletotrichum somersetense]
MATSNGSARASLTNYVSFQRPRGSAPRIGHYDLEAKTIQPLSFVSGTPLRTIYEVIEAGEERIAAYGEPVPADSVKILAPVTGRDVLCVGKNYAEHAKEFNSSGFDSSDKVDQPSHPVIFTKRFTSIIASGEDIYPHPDFTQTVDFEGEIGVIVGKAGYRVSEADAWDHVWGFTIVNDVTARERQRDHKQFYIGKSPDTFCPMGPIAVPLSKVGKKLAIQTHINGELRQNATTDDLIFSIPFLIKTLSEGQTIAPGDVLATGTPAGVGIGRKPPVYLQPNDEISISVSGLGTLTNRIGGLKSENPVPARISGSTTLQSANAAKAPFGSSLTTINGKPLNYKRLGVASGVPLVFVHGLGGTNDFWLPLIGSLGLDKSHPLHLFDLEGHGLSPTSPLSKLSIRSFAEDLEGVFRHAGIEGGAVLFGHSMGSLVATRFALDHPDKITKLVLLGCPPSPLPAAAASGSLARADTARTQGMAAVVDAVVGVGTSDATKARNPVSLAAVRLSLLGQDPEGYAKACAALAGSSEETLDFSRIRARTLLITGAEDNISPPQLNEKLAAQLPDSAGLKVLDSVGHWQVYEDAAGVAGALDGFLS